MSLFRKVFPKASAYLDRGRQIRRAEKLHLLRNRLRVNPQDYAAMREVLHFCLKRNWIGEALHIADKIPNNEMPEGMNSALEQRFAPSR
jgi:hypothetical protein